MKRKILLFAVLLVATAGVVYGQSQEKELSAQRIGAEIEIDGNLFEAGWAKAEPATDFIQQDPYPGAEASLPTEVRVLYDDNAIYIGVRLYDPVPESILRELSERNVIGNADHFEVIIDPYRDGINGYSFAVTSSGVQRDARMYGDRKDAAWDAVWESAVVIDSLGWTVEMRIPYSAIRFPKIHSQQWGVNFGRNIRQTREQSWWNEIDPSLDGVLQQSGMLTDLINIEPPVRLSLYPFLAVSKDYTDFVDENPWGVSGGLDLKYGISQAFTLDVTLIPDFSQALSDRDVLNLSPFEVVFDENRQFFTEGME
nr:carbohydrate binding family 9 domain-containing protein [Saprospiraceae bacterium]